MNEWMNYLTACWKCCYLHKYTGLLKKKKLERSKDEWTDFFFVLSFHSPPVCCPLPFFLILHLFTHIQIHKIPHNIYCNSTYIHTPYTPSVKSPMLNKREIQRFDANCEAFLSFEAIDQDKRNKQPISFFLLFYTKHFQRISEGTSVWGFEFWKIRSGMEMLPGKGERGGVVFFFVVFFQSRLSLNFGLNSNSIEISILL